MANLYKRVGSDFLVNTQTANNQSGPHVTRLSSGGFIIVWTDGSTVGDPDFGIKAQIFDSTGAKVGAEFLVNTTTAGTQSGARVTELPSGRFIITWTDQSATGGDTSGAAVRGQLFEANGTAVGAEFLVNSVSFSSQAGPTIAALSGGGFVIAWQDSSGLGFDTSASGIKAQLFDSNGAKVGGEFLANSTTFGSQLAPTVMALAGGGFAIGWYESSGSGASASGNVRVQMFDSAGFKVGPELLVNSSSAGQFFQPNLAPLASGFLVTWVQQDSPLVSGIAATHDVRGQLFDSAGNKVGAEFVVNTTTAGTQQTPSAAALPGGGFIVVWQGPAAEGTSALNVYAQIFDSSGARVGVEFVLSSVTSANQGSPTVTVLESGDIVLSWQDNSGIGGDSSGIGIKAEILRLTTDAPTDISLSAASISETAREDVGLVKLTTTGALNSSFAYELLSDSTGGAFRIEGDKLVVDNRSLLNFESAPTVQLQIRSTDLNGNSFTETIQLAITDTPEAGYAAGDQFLVNTVTTGNQTESQITWLSSGDFIITWQDWNSGGRGQIYNSDGNRVGSEFSMNGLVAALPSGGFVAAMQTSGGDGSYGGVSVRLYDSLGNPIGGEIAVNSQTAGDQAVESIAVLESGGFVVTWADRQITQFGFQPADVRAQMFDSNGAKVGAEFLPHSSTSQDQSGSQVAALESGGFVITWFDSFLGGLRGQVYDANGARVGLDFRIDNSSPAAAEQRIVGLPGGGFVVIWSKNYSSGGYTGVGDLTAQLFDAQGVRIGSEILITSNGPAQVHSIDVSALDWGGFVVAWSNQVANEAVLIHAQVFDSTGGRVGDELAVTESGGDDIQASVSGLPSGGFVVSWTGGDGNGFGVQARLYQEISVISGTAGDDVLNGTPDPEQMFGEGGNDTLNAFAGNDLLDGGTGNDALNGGNGNDIYIVDSSGDVVTENAGEGTDEVRTGLASYTLAANVEKLTGTSGGGQSLTGNGLDNIISGGAGADAMSGGAGNDTYIVGAGDSVAENAGEGTDEVRTALASFTLGANFENLTGTSASGQTLTGNAANNAITGGTGNDVIDGGAGGDVMAGGLGNDVYFVDSGSDAVVDSGGTDEVRTGLASYTAGLGIEKLTGTSSLGQILASSGFTAITITGGSGDDTLIGNGGSTLIGGLGNDIYVDPHGHPSFTVENPGEGVDEIRFSSYQWFLADNFENLIGTSSSSFQVLYGNSANNVLRAGTGGGNLYGEGGDDTLIGSAANEQLSGGAGADHMTGGGGDDFYVDVGAGDQVVEQAGGGTDSVNTSLATYVLPDHVENLTATASSAQSLTGNALANHIYGTSYNDIIDGGAGNDTLEGSFGDDIYVIDSLGDTIVDFFGDNDQVRTSLSNYSLVANIERLTGTSAAGQTLTGNDLANVITGGSGNDILAGGAGSDTLAGGLGDDVYDVDGSDIVVEAAGGGTDTVRSSVSYTLTANVERLTATGSGGLTLTGNALANLITGNASANTLDGKGGADNMVGGLGNDIYIVDNVGDLVTEATSAGTDSVQSSVSFTLGANFENLVLLAGALNGTGNSLANSITGNGANNILNGMGGADAMAGGAGHDTYHVDNAGDVVTEAASAGNDTVLASTTYTLGDNVEYLTLTGTASISATGNALNNIINGNGSANFIVGGLGADFMTGNGGDDTYFVDNASDKVFESAGGGTDTVSSSVNWALGAEVERLVLTGTLEINGIGNDLANIITGNASANRLDGGIGADTMQGGLGNDTYIIDNAGDVATDTGGLDTVQSSVTVTLHSSIDNLILTGANAIDGTGNGLWNVMTGNGAANTLDGGVGNDVLNGGLGADMLIGGAGHDTYHVDNVGDQVIDTGGGNDHVHSSISYTLGADLEYLTLTGTAASATGNAKNNLLYGNAGSNVIDGGLGADTMVGGLGDDIYYVENGSDQITEHLNQGNDTVMSSVHHALRGNIENLTLIGTNAVSATGNELANVITGNSANNVISGALGADTLSGGGGNDVYQYRFVTESTAASKDQINGFNAGDKINLSILDANTGTSANNDAFTFIGANAFSNTAGELRATESGGVWTIQADVNGDGIADLVIGLSAEGGYIIGAGDFVL